MLILGHHYIESETLYHVSDIESVLKTPPGSTIFLEFGEENLDIIDYLKANTIPFALEVTTIKELLFASAFGAKYIVVDETLCESAQKVAEEYLFDAKILVHIQDEEEMEKYAFLGIDGVVFPTAIVKITQ